jgi:excisionase family DNA binding protein
MMTDVAESTAHEARAIDAGIPNEMLYGNTTMVKPACSLDTSGGYLTNVAGTYSIAMDLRQGAKRVGLGLTRFRQEADAGRIRTFRSGRRRLVSETALHEYVTRLESESSKESDGAGPEAELG